MTMLTEGGVASLLRTEGHFETDVVQQIVNIRRVPAK